MPYNIETPSNDVIVAHLDGDLSIAEISELNNEIATKHFSKGGEFYLVYEVSELKKFPMEIQGLRKASEPIASYSGVKYQIVSGVKSPIFNFLFDLIGQLFRQQLKKTNTLADAVKFIDEVRVATK